MIYKDETTLADRILMLLTHFKLNKSEFARICGVTPTNISDILSGKSKNPQRTFYVDISKNLDISLEWLMTGEGRMLKTKEDVMANEDSDNHYQEIIKNLLYDKYMLEIELGKSVEQTPNETLVGVLEHAFA